MVIESWDTSYLIDKFKLFHLHPQFQREMKFETAWHETFFAHTVMWKYFSESAVLLSHGVRSHFNHPHFCEGSGSSSFFPSPQSFLNKKGAVKWWCKMKRDNFKDNFLSTRSLKLDFTSFWPHFTFQMWETSLFVILYYLRNGRGIATYYAKRATMGSHTNPFGKRYSNNLMGTTTKDNNSSEQHSERL